MNGRAEGTHLRMAPSAKVTVEELSEKRCGRSFGKWPERLRAASTVGPPAVWRAIEGSPRGMSA